MKLSVVIRLAIKNIMRRRNRYVVTILGVSFAVVLMVILVGLGYGIQNLVIKDFTTLEALRTIDVMATKSEQIELNEETFNNFKDISSVREIYPVVELGGKLSYKNSVTDVAILGLDGNVFSKWTSVELADEKIAKSFTGHKIVVSRSALQLIGISDIESAKNKEVSLSISLSGFLEKDDTSTVDEKFTIVTNENRSQSPMVIIPIDVLEKLGVVRYSMAKIVVTSAEEVPKTRLMIEKMGFTTRSAQDTVDQIEQVFSVMRIALSVFGLVAGAIAALGMFNTLTVSLLEKTKEVGILKALGVQRKAILQLFLTEAFVMAIVGSITGLIGGILISKVVQLALGSVAQVYGYNMNSIFSFPPLFLLIVFASAFIIGGCTGFYPAFKASKINTLDALRYE